MRKEDLQEYEFRELALISDHSAEVVKRGKVIDAPDLYPDLKWPTDVAFPRGLVPLALLLLLYEKLVLYIPPTSPPLLEQRWKVSLGTVLRLCHRGYIQPLIGHPTDYRHKHFDPLLELKPPSVWARGLGLLRALGMEGRLDEGQTALPINRIASLSWVQRRWKRHFPAAAQIDLRERIKQELATQYADLWLFGLGDIARALAHLKNPSTIAQALFLTNEVRTYPVLFGLGGTAHYDLAGLQAEPSLLDAVRPDQSTRKAIVIPSELEVLLRGIGINIDRLDFQGIVDFHASGCGRHLRQAVSEFDKQARHLVRSTAPSTMDPFFNAAAELQEVIKEADKLLSSPGFRRSVRSTKARVQWLFRAGGLAVGAWIGNALGGAWLETLAVAPLGVEIVERLVPAAWREKAVTTAVAEQFSPGIAHMWRIAETRAGREHE